MTMHAQDRVYRTVPHARDMQPRNFVAIVVVRFLGLIAMVQQKIEGAGINNVLATIIAGIMVAGILGVVGLSWNTSVTVAGLQGQIQYLTGRVSDMHDDLSALKGQLSNDGRDKQHPNQ